MKIVMLMAVYHEEVRIQKFLELHRDLVDCIVLIHDGPCSDRTIAIARSFGCDAFATQEHFGYCEPVREFARKRALALGYSWGIVSDPDETWDPVFMKDLPRICEEADANESVIIIVPRITRYVPSGVYPDVVNDLQARIFKLTHGYFTDVIHTNVTAFGGTSIIIEDRGFIIQHENRVEDVPEKTARYTKIAENLMSKYSGEPRTSQHLRVAAGQGG